VLVEPTLQVIRYAGIECIVVAFQDVEEPAAWPVLDFFWGTHRHSSRYCQHPGGFRFNEVFDHFIVITRPSHDD
jgi:hypothetical protein